MSITERDKKILAVLAVIGVLAGYWFLLLSPKREEAADLESQVSQQTEQRDAAMARAQQAEAAKASFASDYAEMVRLGKAIPSGVDMPSLLVQLDRAADGTHIDLENISVGQRAPAATPAPAPAPQSSGGAAEPGGEPAQSAPGQAAENAAETAEELETQTSTDARDAAAPSATAQAASAGSGIPGLDSLPIEFTFTGTYFDLADFFHRLKRFVRLGEDGIVVRGRLMTIDSLNFAGGADDDASDGELTAKVKATVYLAPEREGATAGATPSGPAPQSQQTASSSGPATPPTATVQP